MGVGGGGEGPRAAFRYGSEFDGRRQVQCVVHSCYTALWSKKYILVIQTDEQQRAMKKLQESGMLLHLDATGQTNSYNCPLFALLYYVRAHPR